MPTLAIIIPVLNDTDALAVLLRALQPWRDRCELVVVDGGSYDGSAALARTLADIVIVSEPGRARQMQAGADAVQAPWLWFLHADSVVPPALFEAVLSLPADAQWGRCDVRLDDSRWLLRCVGACMNLRSRLTGICTGDQGMFVRADLFRRIGGYAQIPLMEDIELSARLRRHAAPVCVRPALQTSARRWRQQGVVRTIVLMWWLRLQFFFGVAPQRLFRRYYSSPFPPNE